MPCPPSNWLAFGQACWFLFITLEHFDSVKQTEFGISVIYCGMYGRNCMKFGMLLCPLSHNSDLIKQAKFGISMHFPENALSLLLSNVVFTTNIFTVIESNSHFHGLIMSLVCNLMRKTIRYKSNLGIWSDKFSPKHSQGPDWCVGLCLLRVIEVWRLFAPDLRKWINSFSCNDFKSRLIYKIWYFCYFFTNIVQQF